MDKALSVSLRKTRSMKFAIAILLFSVVGYGQVSGPEFRVIDQKLDSIEQIKLDLTKELELIRLAWIKKEITAIGLPQSGRDIGLIEHAAMTLSYNEEHEQANWVMHVILPAIMEGNISRSNDFREDSLVKTGTATEIDYFLKELKPDSTFRYDGFGYDRGHLAPSADFRWSETALSESYFYSNMSPQLADFNRDKWAELENNLREYVISNEVHLVVVTAPILSSDLPKIERSTNAVSVPAYFVKAVLDTKHERAIAYLMPNTKITQSLDSYAVCIDSVEQVLGIDLFPNLEDELEQKIEAEANYQLWQSADEKGDVLPIIPKRLPKNGFSTKDIYVLVGNEKKRTVCGTVVSTKKHDKGHVFINLDKKFPNQVFSVSIFDSNISNFDYEPAGYLINKEVCFTGYVTEFNETPNMVIEHGKQVKLLDDY